MQTPNFLELSLELVIAQPTAFEEVMSPANRACEYAMVIDTSGYDFPL